MSQYLRQKRDIVNAATSAEQDQMFSLAKCYLGLLCSTNVYGGGLRSSCIRCTGLLYFVIIALIGVWLPCIPRREKPALSHSMVMQFDVHSVIIASLKLILRLYAMWLKAVEYITPLKIQNSKFSLMRYPKREKQALSHKW